MTNSLVLGIDISKTPFFIFAEILSCIQLSDKEKILSRAYTDLIYFGRAFLPNDFLNKSQSPEFHHIIGKKLITTKPGARLCNILPRGFGKSIIGLFY